MSISIVVDLGSVQIYAKSMEEQIRAQAEGKTLHVVISRARMDAAFVPVFKESLAKVWFPGLTKVIIDLSLVEFVDSSGVGAMLGILRRLPQHEASVALKGVSPQVRNVLELLRLQKIFHIES